MDNKNIKYGAVVNIPISMQRIGYDVRGLFVGANDKGEYVLINRTINSIRAIVGEPSFLTDSMLNALIVMPDAKEIKLLPGEIRFAEKILKRRGL